MYYAVIVLRGPASSPEHERVIGPFGTEAAAAEWCSKEGIALESVVGATEPRRAIIVPFVPRP